jgi:hypothetical protein
MQPSEYFWRPRGMTQRLVNRVRGLANCVHDREWAIGEGGRQQDDFWKGDIDLRHFQESAHSAEVVSHCCALPGWFQERDIIPGHQQRSAYPAEVLSCCQRNTVKLTKSRCLSLHCQVCPASLKRQAMCEDNHWRWGQSSAQGKSLLPSCYSYPHLYMWNMADVYITAMLSNW